jgi:hypothetical protein
MLRAGGDKPCACTASRANLSKNQPQPPQPPQDVTRTGTYHSAILDNRPDFDGKVIMDVGAGSGILSLFAAQAGAAKVYAVEASGMAKFAAKLAAANPTFGKAVEVLHSKVEELSLPEGEKVDVLVSEVSERWRRMREGLARLAQQQRHEEDPPTHPTTHPTTQPTNRPTNHNSPWAPSSSTNACWRPTSTRATAS